MRAGPISTPERRPTDPQGDLPLLGSPNRERTIHCDNCLRRFVAYYGTKEDAEPETIDVEKFGPCGGDPSKVTISRTGALRQVAELTARNIKRG
jgi:hypothetical protein